MKSENDSNKTQRSQGTILATKHERTFTLSLRALVTGRDAFGREIRERTRITSISSKRAIFLLKAKTVLNAPMFLAIDIPSTLILQGPLDLFLSGNVVLVTEQKNRKSQSVTLDLKQTYKINSQTLSNPA